MMRLTLLSAAAISAVHASVSTSVFPNSLCQGASNSLGGLVGVGKVTLANGEVEVHCGCPSDNLADFEACPSSATGESVCNSVYDMSSGQFSASCGVIACAGADCLNTIVNEVVTHDEECFNSERGSIGITTIDGEASCACSSEVDAADFKACAAPVNGKATCTTTDPDFLGASYEHVVEVSCGVVCNDGYVLTPGGACSKVVKRDMNFASQAPIKIASSSAGAGSWGYGSSAPGSAVPTTTYHPHQAHTTSGATPAPSATTTSYSYKYHHARPSNGGGENGYGSNSYVAPSSSRTGWYSSVWASSWSSASSAGGNNHNSQPTTTPGAGGNGGDMMSSSSMMAAPTTTSYSYNQWNGYSTKANGGGSAAASSSMMHWAHKRDAVPTNQAYVYKQHKARAGVDHLHRRASSSASGMYMPSSSSSGMYVPPVATSSGGYGGSSMPPSMVMPTTTPSGSNHYAHTTPGSGSSTTDSMMMPTTTSYSYKYHHRSSSWPGAALPSSSGAASSSGSWSNWYPVPSMGPSGGSNHNAQPSASSSSSTGGMASTTGAATTTTTTGGMMYGSSSQPIKYGSSTAAAGGMATPGPSQRARRASDEFVFSDVCAQDERTCPGDIMCVRLDDVTECGGCHATGDAVNCLEIPGASSVSCLRGGCVVRSCQTGYFQTAEGRCERL